MADEDRADDERSETATTEEAAADGESQQVTAPGDWERKPADPDDLRHDDGSEPLEPPSKDGDEDLAEQEAGDVSAGDDEGFHRPDPPEEAGVEDTGETLSKHSGPLLEGPEIPTPFGGVPTRSLLAMAAFVLVFCLAFFVLWGLLGSIGILLGIIAGVALGLVAMKLLADRAS